MDFADKMQELSNRIPKQKEHIQTEEATKNAFVMPFISALGYDVFNPMEVVPEFTADTGTKKGEKVDYAIKKDDKIIILIECKWCGSDLCKNHASQLYRYFSVVDARFAILTNGIIYRFYSDVDEPNKMDGKPFFEFNILEYDEQDLSELKKFTKPSFDIENILATAEELKYTKAIRDIFADETTNPSEGFVKYFASQVYSGRLTQPVVEQFTGIVKGAFNQFLRDKINSRLMTALESDGSPGEATTVIHGQDDTESNNKEDRGIITTEEEIEGFNIIKAICREIIDPKRIYMRDTKSYCGILLDDNNRKPICRLHFNYSQKYIGIISNKEENRIPIDDLNDLFKYADAIKSTATEYMSENP